MVSIIKFIKGNDIRAIAEQIAPESLAKLTKTELQQKADAIFGKIFAGDRFFISSKKKAITLVLKDRITAYKIDSIEQFLRTVDRKQGDADTSTATGRHELSKLIHAEHPAFKSYEIDYLLQQHTIREKFKHLFINTADDIITLKPNAAKKIVKHIQNAARDRFEHTRHYFERLDRHIARKLNCPISKIETEIFELSFPRENATQKSSQEMRSKLDQIPLEVRKAKYDRLLAEVQLTTIIKNLSKKEKNVLASILEGANGNINCMKNRANELVNIDSRMLKKLNKIFDLMIIMEKSLINPELPKSEDFSSPQDIRNDSQSSEVESPVGSVEENIEERLDFLAKMEALENEQIVCGNLKDLIGSNNQPAERVEVPRRRFI